MSIKATVEIVREAERLRITGLSRVQWWRLERAGSVPKRVQLGVNSVGWLRHELEAWLADRAAGRPTPTDGSPPQPQRPKRSTPTEQRL
jgi:predicted DNA-binding transcriptional regulator AlpA